MATKKKSKARKAVAKADRKDNHITGHSRTACYRLSLGLYEAVQSEAKRAKTSTGKQAMRWLIDGARKAGYKITPETLAFAGL
jgi:hypothetical protein